MHGSTIYYSTSINKLHGSFTFHYYPLADIPNRRSSISSTVFPSLANSYNFFAFFLSALWIYRWNRLTCNVWCRLQTLRRVSISHPWWSSHGVCWSLDTIITEPKYLVLVCTLYPSCFVPQQFTISDPNWDAASTDSCHSILVSLDNESWYT